MDDSPQGRPSARRPADVPVRDWVERQIRDAQARGAFTGLRGEGKPIPDLHRQRSSHQWVLDWAEREGADLAAALPLGLALRRERAELRAALPELRSEHEVEEVVQDFNARLRDAYLRPASGPPLAVGPLDLPVQLERWRDARPPRPAPPPSPAPPAARRPPRLLPALRRLLPVRRRHVPPDRSRPAEGAGGDSTS